MKTATELITEAKGRIREVTVDEAIRRRADDPGVLVLDVREPNEWNLGHVQGAQLIPRGLLESNIEAAAPRERSVIIYCASGNRSALAADTMQQMGYRDVVSLRGGFRAWAEAGGPIDD
ncbi:MAG: sulfurtransferase [Gemmatimonadaceae bacterium]|nr:sulfurtransferase [Gemmatimonadaceae bacterium]